MDEPTTKSDSTSRYCNRLREALETWEAWQRQDIALSAMQAAVLIRDLEPAAGRFLALTETGQRVEWCETHNAQAVDKWTCHKRARPSFQPLECHIVSKLLIPADYLTEERGPK